MKLLHLTKIYFPDNGGGVSQAVQSLADCFRDKDEEILVCQRAPGMGFSTDQYDGVGVVRCPQLFDVASTPFSVSFLRQWRRRTDADTISIYSFPYPLCDIGILLHAYRGKLAVWWHCDFVSYKRLAPFFRPLVRHTLKAADVILVSSDGTIDGSDLLPQFREKCLKVPYVVSDTYLRLGREAMAARDASQAFGTGPRDGRVRLLFMGRMVWYKGCDILLRVFARLCQEAGVVSYELTFVGGGFLEEEYISYASSLGLSYDRGEGDDPEIRLHFLGYVSEEKKIEAIKRCDFLVMPSTSTAESFGIVQIEAMAFGKPVINTRLASGVPDVSIDGETGMTIEPSDEAALYDAIRTLGEQPALRERYGQAAFARVQTHYTKNQMKEIVGRRFAELFNCCTDAQTQKKSRTE